jgi:hypothetical protein
MAGGQLTKQATFLSFKFLNDVNDAAAGGVPVSLPAGAPVPQSSQTLVGDRIVLDDATALALSDAAIGTLFGGIYMYVQTLSSSTAAPARGTAAFIRAADFPGGASAAYQVTADAQPTTAIPTFIAGVFINAITKGNFGWIQIGGTMSCLFDSAITTAAVGSSVSVKITAAVASTFDVGVVVTTATIPIGAVNALVGMAIDLPVISTITRVHWTRNPFVRI